MAATAVLAGATALWAPADDGALASSPAIPAASTADLTLDDRLPGAFLGRDMASASSK
jgi:hypothetical protein